MVDRPLPVSQDEIDQVLSGYGVGQKTGTITPANDDEAAQILKGYGVTLKPGATQQNAAPSSYEETFKGSIEAKKEYEKRRAQDKPGKIPTEPEEPPTKAEAAAGERRGLGAQFVGGVPILGPGFNLLTASVPGHGTFSQRLYEQQQADRAFAMAHPYESAAAQFAGGLVGYGGIARAAPWAMGLTAPTLGGRIWQGGLGGAGINALDAAMRGENPVTAAEIGAAGGVVAPLASEGARAATGTVANNMFPRTGPLEGIPRAGINLLQRGLEGETPASIAAAGERMGPRGFLSDLTQGMTDIAGAIADTPGPGKTLVREAYRQRNEGQRQAVEGAVTRAFGPRINLADVTRAEKADRAAAANPLYEAWRDTRVTPTPELKELGTMLEEEGFFKEANRLLKADGKETYQNFFTPGARKQWPTAEAWDYVKQAIDGKIQAATPTATNPGSPNEVRIYTKLKNRLTDAIDNHPDPRVAGVWAEARQAWANPTAIMNARTAGQDVWKSSTRPDELGYQLTDYTPPERAAFLQGARDSLSTLMDRSRGGDTQARNMLLAPVNQEKTFWLTARHGYDPQELTNALQSEIYLGEKGKEVVPNFATGASNVSRAERKRMFDAPQLPPYLENVNLVQPATWIPPGLRPANVLQAFRNERAGRVAPSLANVMLTPQGPQMDALVDSLRAQQNRTDLINRTTGRYLINPLQIGIAGPGQETYRLGYENAQPPPAQP